MRRNLDLQGNWGPLREEAETKAREKIRYQPGFRESHNSR